jgi:hypothetical protein
MAVPQRFRPFVTFALVSAGIACVVLAGQAAVLPLTSDLPADSMAGPRAGLLPSSPYEPVAGSWIGHTASGRDVRFELKITGDGISGSASLPDLVPDEGTPLPVTSLSLTERVLVFRLKPRPCGADAAYGILTFVSADSARLDLQSGKTPVTLLLSKIS